MAKKDGKAAPSGVPAREIFFGDALEEQRQAADLSRRGFADKLGVSSAFLYDLLRGEANPTFRTMDELAEAMGLEFTPQFYRRRSPSDGD